MLNLWSGEATHDSLCNMYTRCHLWMLTYYIDKQSGVSNIFTHYMTLADILYRETVPTKCIKIIHK